MRLKLGHKVMLTVNDSKSVLVPESLVITEGSKKWLKISPISDSIVKLIITDMVFEGGSPTKTSLAEANGLIERSSQSAEYTSRCTRNLSSCRAFWR